MTDEIETPPTCSYIEAPPSPSRYIEPKARPPRPELINHYLGRAMPGNGAPPEERRAAEAALLELYRGQKAAGAIDPRLVHFVQTALWYCGKQPDPLGAVEDFMKAAPRKLGRPHTPHHDLIIAADIEKRVAAGSSIAAACRELEPATGLTGKQLRRIYKGQKKADPQGIALTLAMWRA